MARQVSISKDYVESEREVSGVVLKRTRAKVEMAELRVVTAASWSDRKQYNKNQLWETKIIATNR